MAPGSRWCRLLVLNSWYARAFRGDADGRLGEGDTFVVEFDVPGEQPETLDIDMESNVLTVPAERPAQNRD